MHKTQIGLNERHRMKNYIHTLTQSSSTRVSEEALKPLQAALSQSESEKKRLLETVKELDAKIQALTYEKQFSIYSQPDDQVLECLKIKLDQVVAENTLMKKEIRTALMLKLGETEKLRHLETVLRFL